jgi:hypothetical protein
MMSNLSATQIEALPPADAAKAVETAIAGQQLELLTALAASTSKALAKLAKKGLYQLKSKGVAVPETPPARPSTPPATATEELPAVLSSIIGTGERALLFARPVKGHGLESFQCVLSDTLGLLDVTRGETSRGDYKKHLKAIRGQPQGFIEVPFSRVVEELEHALFLHHKQDTGLPTQDAESLVRRLGLTAQERSLPPLPEDKGLAAQSHSLHQEREIASWLPPEPLIRVLMQRIEEVRVSPLQLSEAQRVDQSRKKLELTAREFATAEIAALYSRRLQNMAEVFAGTGRADAAQRASAEAARLRSDDATAISPFFVALFEKVLTLSMQAAQQHATSQGLGAQPAPEAPPERRSPGGLILP